jgi:hypothetical protein
MLLSILYYSLKHVEFEFVFPNISYIFIYLSAVILLSLIVRENFCDMFYLKSDVL